VSNKNVVETGILNRVKMIRNIGDATFKKENWVGIASEPSLHLGQLRMKEEAISK
jgi:hypothetical protein